MELLNNIKFNYEYKGKQKDTDTWEHHSYVVTLEHNGKKENFPWKQGLLVESDPTLEDVMEALLLDIHYYEEDIYSLFEDEEEAKRIIKELEEQRFKMEELFTDEELGDLTEYFEEI